MRPSDSASERTLLLRRDSVTISSLMRHEAIERGHAAVRSGPRFQLVERRAAPLRASAICAFHARHRARRPTPRCAAPAAPGSRARVRARSGRDRLSAAGPRRAERAAASSAARNASAASCAGPNDSRCALRLVFSTASGRISSSSRAVLLEALGERVERPPVFAVAERLQDERSAVAVLLDRLARAAASSAAAADASSVSAMTARLAASAALVNSTWSPRRAGALRPAGSAPPWSCRRLCWPLLRARSR